MLAADDHDDKSVAWRSHAGIPVRNLWMLLVYASDLARFLDPVDASVDDDAKLPDLLAKLLIAIVERRLRRNLSRGYQAKAIDLTRVRGRIDWLATETGLLLQRGRVACRFEELTHDTPRNRLVRAALERMRDCLTNRDLIIHCASLARQLELIGVKAGRPSRGEISRDRISRNDDEDKAMVTVAVLSLELTIPSERGGAGRLTQLDRDEHLLRRIYEKAVAGIYLQELHGHDGWYIRPQVTLNWQTANATSGLAALLPSMSADVVLEQDKSRRIVLDTKFTGIVTARRYGGEAFKSGHLYQIYAYIRSQTGRDRDDLAERAEGLLLHPTLDRHVDEAVDIQGHRIRFVTVDLSLPAAALRSAILNVVRTKPIAKDKIVGKPGPGTASRKMSLSILD